MNVFQYAASSEKWFEEYLSTINYERKYTFFSDLSLAEPFGAKAVKDTIKNVLKGWMDNIEAITEFAMSVNMKSWQMSDLGKTELMELYSEEFYKIQDKIYKHYKGNNDALEYYYEMTD